jgi:hypothetical protein
VPLAAQSSTVVPIHSSDTPAAEMVPLESSRTRVLRGMATAVAVKVLNPVSFAEAMLFLVFDG